MSFAFDEMRLPVFLDQTVNAVCARASCEQQQVATRDSQVLQEHDLVNFFGEVNVEDQCRQNREARGKDSRGTGQETEQNGQTAAKLQQNGQWQQRARYAH